MSVRTSARSRKLVRPGLDWLGLLTQIAFIVSLAVVCARCMLLETLREPFSVSPGDTPYPRGPGAASTLAMDLIGALPAILILIRAVFDQSYKLRWSWSYLLMFPLGIWMTMSIRWADDRFATLVGSTTFLAALCLMWSASQLVRTWRDLRIVAAFAYGMLLINLAQGYYYKYVDFPDTVKSFKENRNKILSERNLVPGSFAASQFEKKILSGELYGFYDSSNSYAAILLLLTTIAAGITIQRWLDDKENPLWAVAIVLAAPLAIYLLYYTQSKAALVSLVLIALLIAFIWRFRIRLAGQSVRWYWAGVGIVGTAMAAVIGHGLWHHSLPTASLLYRWRYWVASARIFRGHPLLGIGWENFRLYYMQYRLPAASEEIRDPHNFLVRFFVELGAVGGVLIVAFMLRIWWEMTRPTAPVEIPIASVAGFDRMRDFGLEDDLPPGSRVLPTFGLRARHRPTAWMVLVAALIAVIKIVAGIDFAQIDFWFYLIEFVKIAMFLAAMLIGVVIVSVRSVQDPRFEDRRAPWVLYSMMIGVGVFLIHNLIEFSLFEAGPLCMFALLVGSVMGIRLSGKRATNTGNAGSADTLSPANVLSKNVAGNAEPKPMGFLYRTLVITALAAFSAAWAAELILAYIPTARAELAAQAGDDALRDKHIEDAFENYRRAEAILPLNADYAYRTGRALHIGAMGIPPREVSAELRQKIGEYLDRAIRENPREIDPLLERSRLNYEKGSISASIADFAAAVNLNPNEAQLHMQFADSLEMMNHPHEAAEQLRLALYYNDLLDPGEPKRLSAGEVATIAARMRVLSGV